MGHGGQVEPAVASLARDRLLPGPLPCFTLRRPAGEAELVLQEPLLGTTPHPHPSLITFPGQPLSGKVWSRVLSFSGCSTCYLGKCGSSKNLNIFQHVSVTRTEQRVTQCPSKPQMWFRNLVVAWMLFLGLRPSEESALPQTALAFLCKGIIFQQQRKYVFTFFLNEASFTSANAWFLQWPRATHEEVYYNTHLGGGGTRCGEEPNLEKPLQLV